MEKQKLNQLLQHLDDDMLRYIDRSVTKILTQRSLSKVKSRKRSYVSKKPHVSMLKLFDDDWAYLFDSYDNNDKSYYVYAHFDPRSKWVKLSHKLSSIKCPFYIGMGKNNRSTNVHSRSRFHKEKLSTLIDVGFDIDQISHVILDGLTETAARELESKLIYFFGCASSNYISINGFGVNGKTSLYGGKPCLINQQYEPLPHGSLIERVDNTRSNHDGSFNNIRKIK